MDWSDEHIASWLKWCEKQLELWPVPRPEDFPSTGTELCSLDRTEFDRRSRNRRSGRLLLLHLSLLRQPVTGTPPSPSLITSEDGKWTHNNHWRNFLVLEGTLWIVLSPQIFIKIHRKDYLREDLIHVRPREFSFQLFELCRLWQPFYYYSDRNIKD